MSEETPSFARKTHDLYAFWLNREGRTQLSLVGIRMQTDLGQHVEFLFDGAAIADAVLLAKPVGLSLNSASGLLSALIP